MTKLGTLRSRLASLRRWRVFVRQATAFSAPLTAVLWTLVAVFVVDVVFEMDVVQRLIVMLIGAGALVWAYARYSTPLLGIRETDTEMALMVERQHRINSDLVAALQFESPEAGEWGSRQLEDAVIEGVAGVSRRLDVFEGFSREQMGRRMALLFATAAVIGAAVYAFPEFARIYADRLMLGATHYPSATKIEHVIVNRHSVLLRHRDGNSPVDAKSPESHPMEFLVHCSGRLPSSGKAELRSSAGRKRPVGMKRLTLNERQSRLEDAATRIRKAVQDRSVDTTGPWSREIATLVRFDAPEVAALVEQAGDDPAKLPQVADHIDELLAAWPGDAAKTAIYSGRLARLVDSVTYQLYFGDAWTDPAEVRMIPLPVIEPKLTPVAPDYAKAAAADEVDPSVRHLSVLEGSQVKVSVECTNKKRLTDAWLIVTSDEEPRRYSLIRQDDRGFAWALADSNTSFSQISREVRFEIQVTDEDDLHLETPIRGYIRIKADRPPTCTAGIVHRVVLPEAKPVIEYRAADDYGIAELALHIQIERAQNNGEEVAPDERQTVPILMQSQPILADQLPLVGTYELDLASIRVEQEGQPVRAEVAKGDRLKLTLETIDYRGETPGESHMSDPLVLEISDESGVLAAISEADERSEQRLTDIIKQQLGIGSE